MENSKFRVSIDTDDKVVSVKNTTNGSLQFNRSDDYEHIWIKTKGLAFYKDNLLSFVGASMLSVDLFQDELAMELYELRTEGHYIFSTSHRHIHFHPMGATEIFCPKLRVYDNMTIEEVQAQATGFSTMNMLFFLCGLIL
jgi:hypothetical protein